MRDAADWEHPEQIQVSSFRFRPPRQHIEIIERPILVEYLDNASGLVTLLQAPAGYGKTTLLAHWWEDLTARGVRAAWLSVDEDSRTPIEFVGQIIEAVGHSGLDVGELSGAARRSAAPAAARELLKALLKQLDESAGRQILIIDDYHLAQSPEIDDLLDLFVRRLPDRARLVIATRQRPGLALAALRAQGQLLELGAGRLRFSSDEIARLLGEEIQDERLQGMMLRSEGWPIALQLARLWVHDGAALEGEPSASFSSGEELADFLTTQVFDGLLEPLRLFLLEMSGFPGFNSDFADCVRDATDSLSLMEQLRRRNMLMIPTDASGSWYRQHHLISDFLSARRSQLGPNRLNPMHARASAWFEQRGMRLEAVRHAAVAKDRARAVALVEDADCLRLCVEEGIHGVQSLFAQLMPEEIKRSGRLRPASVLVLFKLGKLQEGADELDAAESEAAQASAAADSFREDLLILKALKAVYRREYLADADRRAFETLMEDAPKGRPWLNGHLSNLLCLSLLRQGVTQEAELCVRKAARHFEETGNLHGYAFMSLHLATIGIAQGRLRHARVALERVEELALEQFNGNASLLALVHLLMAKVAYEENQIERAGDLLRGSLQTVATAEGWPELYEIGFAVAADLAMARGDLAEAESVLVQGCELVRARQAAPAALLFIAKRAHVLVRQGRLDEARAAVAEWDELPSGQGILLWPELDEMVLARAKVALAHDASRVDVEALTRVSGQAASQGRFQSALRADVLIALTWFELDRVDQAVDLIGRVLERAHPNGHRRLFLDEGARMAGLLRETLKQRGPRSSTLAGFLSELLASFIDPACPDDRNRLLGALTPREREILRELSRGVPNKLIARSLDLTENAVKFHLKNIYRKLGVVGRTMAIAVSGKLELCD